MSLRSKIILAIILVIMCLGSTVIFFINQVLPEALKDEVRQANIFRARNLAVRSTNLILTENLLELRELVGEEKERGRDVAYVFVIDSKGDVLVHTFEEGFSAEIQLANSVDPGQLSNVQFLNTSEGFVYDIAVPILIKGEMIGTARIGITEGHIRETVNNILIMIAEIMGVAIILSIFVGFGLANLIVKSVKALHQATEEMMAGNLGVRVKLSPVPCWKIKKCGMENCPSYGNREAPCWHVAGTMCHGAVQGTYAQKIADCKKCEIYQDYVGDEVNQLSVLFNQMAGELKKARDEVVSYSKGLEEKVKQRTGELEEAQDRLIRFEKLAVLGKLAGVVGHELRNPLGAIRNSIYFLRMRLGQTLDEKIKKHLNILDEEVDTSDRIITDILTFGRIKEPQLAKTDINDVIKESLGRERLPGNIEVTAELEHRLPEIQADAAQLRQVFSNLILNAVQAMPAGGSLTIRTGREKVTESGRRKTDKFKLGMDVAVIEFKDTGEGVPEKSLDGIFEPLFSTKIRGTGLGLSVCQSIIEGHKGGIEVESEMGKGTVFRVKLAV
ncbi:MAG: hypothetical protein KKC50_05580 [Candidatus Omnitrophica bacterium]|nr:hypothetical protein [Candidatus Omnitrophota bacterium]